MKLTEDQRAKVASWVGEGLSLSEIQKRLETECELRMTYMDVRFLVDDLDLEVCSAGPEFDDPKVEATPVDTAPGKVRVQLDKVARPDALVSGQVTFSDGESAQWHLDQMGRLSLNAQQPDYRPSQEDLQAFQTELSEAVKKAGLF